ncbi:dienelactone hydrolase family protein [Albidovulum sp.]|uniref:dienelactone hydrolase family protein n=1 Tax=Albidovulum sp. TaxID=1872424 RepID=UPI003529B6DC
MPRSILPPFAAGYPPGIPRPDPSPGGAPGTSPPASPRSSTARRTERCPGRGFIERAGRFAAGVPFYGRQPPAADLPRIEAPLLMLYAGRDTRINEGRPEYEAALRAYGKRYEAFICEGANQGFHNDTTPRSDAAAAEPAWSRTLGPFATHLA